MVRAAASTLSRRILVTLAALVVFRLGCLVPIPSIEAGTIYESAGPLAGDMVARVSVFALGLTPVLFVLVCAEAIKLLFEPLQRWEAASAANRDRLALILRLLALLLAGLQAWQLAWALEGAHGLVREPGWPFEIGVIATIVAATAFLIWLADQITRYGFGPGFWLLWLAPGLSGIGHHLALWREMLRADAITAPQMVLAAIWLVAMVLIVLSLAKARFGRSLLRRDDRALSLTGSLTHSPAAFDVMPLFAGAFVSGLVISFAGRYLPRSPHSLAWEAADLVGVAFFIAFFYFLRARADLALAPLRGEPVDRAAAFRKAWITAAGLIALLATNALIALPFQAFAIQVVTVLVAAEVIEALAAYVPQKVR